MKKSTFLWMSGLLCLASSAASAEDVLMPQLGKQVVIVGDAPVTYYDYKGTESMPATAAGSAYATTIFKPAKEGNAIQLVFEEVEIKTYSPSYNAYLKVYNGVFDTTSVTYPATGSAVTTTGFPHTEAQLDSLVGTYSNLSYISTDATGALSVCLQFKNPNVSKGWKATVRSVEVKPMEVKAAAADYSQVESELYPSKQGVSLAALSITTEGLTPVKTFESLSFRLSGEGIFAPSDLRLYEGNGACTGSLKAISAALTESDGVYTFTLTDYALSSGENLFCIGGDVLADAPFNTVSMLTLTNAKVGGTDYTLAGSPVAQTVAAMVLMGNGSRQMPITQPTLLYDDGGPEGKISNNFEGTYTFYPTTAGHKVMIDMREISLFYTSAAVGVGNEDVLSIYNGAGTSGDSLLYTVKTDKMDSLIVHSTAQSGALTVYLRSKTPSATYQGNGFRATVSEFVPQAMEMASSAVSKADATPAACSKGVDVLSFTLTTKNTEPALVPASFVFSTDDTFVRIEKASLFCGTTLIGEAEVNGNGFTVTPTAAMALREGENTFRVAVDIACTAQTGDLVEVNIQSVAFADAAAYTAFQNPEGAMTIQNTAYSDCGTKSISVLGEWQFTHTQASEYSTRYKAEDCEQTTTFVPTTEGHIIEMDFADFDVYYSSSSYGTKAVFKVYAGTDATGELLWQIDADNKSTGLGKIRSTAADGALTIVFNPKTSSSYYTGNGWHATVREYLPVPMQAGTPVCALPESPVSLVRNLTHTPLATLNIPTTGMLNPLALTQADITIGECAAALDSLLLLQGDEVVGKAAVEQTTVSISIADCTLREGDNTFILAANIAGDAPFGTSVSVKSMSLHVGETTLPLTLPANERPIVNIYCLETEWRKIEVGETPLTFYDAGGPEGNMTAYAKGVVTFVPTEPNTAIALRFKQWNINGADNFYIYYADTVQDKADLSPSYYTQDIADWYVVSEAESGALTVKFSGSYGSGSLAGWEIEVSCHTLTPLVLDSVVVESASPGVATKGSTDVPMLRVAVSVSGDKGSIQVEDIALSALPEGMTGKYYYTGTGNTFAITTPFDAAAPLTRKGTYYYWAAVDITNDMAEGTQSLTCNQLTIDQQTVTPLRSATANLNIISGMHGTYRIGASESADFTTIQAAVDALSIGIDGAVTFQIENGVYNECVKIPDLMGLSATNTLTIESLSGDTADVAIHYEAYSPAYGEEYGVFNIQGADYVTLRNLTFYTGNTSFAGVVYVDNISRHVTVDNCHVYAPMVDSGTSKLRLVYTKALDEANQNNDCFTLSNSLLEGGYVGMYLGGTGYASLPKQVGGTIEGNTFVNQGFQSIYAPGESGIAVRNNRITNNATTKADFKAMDLKLYDGGEISGNTIDLRPDNYAEAIYLRNVESTEDHPMRLFNNAVSVAAGGTSASKALVLTQSAKYLDIAHNTFYTSGDATTLLVQRVPTGLQVRNNICYNAGEGLAFQVSGNWADSITFGPNLLYTEGTVLARLSSTDIADLEAWKTTMGDDKAISEAVAFEEDGLGLSAAGNLRCGEAIDYITTDILGRKRAALPTLGAYEYGTDPSTGLETPGEVVPARKVLLNGTMIILSDGKAYNALGQLVETAVK
ncbi:MAG: NosD domain-containing protein [Paludibacteraceae bacterium]